MNIFLYLNPFELFVTSEVENNVRKPTLGGEVLENLVKRGGEHRNYSAEPGQANQNPEKHGHAVYRVISL